MIGANAGDALTTSGSTDNVAIGKNAFRAAQASAVGNVAIGKDSGLAVTSGDKNTLMGWKSGDSITTGSYNTLIGNEAGENLVDGSGNIVIGYVDTAATDSARTLKITSYDGSTTTNHIIGDSNGVLTFNAANVTQQAITSSSNAVAWDASAKPNAYHITTENTTFSAPSNPVEGAFICLEINYNGSHTIGWNTVFEFAASTEPTETATDAKTDIHVFRYNGAVWQEVGRTMNLSES